MSKSPKISICIPYHDTEKTAFFLSRSLYYISAQTFKDYEIVLTKEGKMAENTNVAIKKAKGEIIKILYMDDYLASPDALQHLADNFKGGWLATGCIHDRGDGKLFNPHAPEADLRLNQGQNTIGSPSVIAFENKDPFLFDENMTWLLDVDLYVRLLERYGQPTILSNVDVVIGLGDHQVTNTLSSEAKVAEHYYLQTKLNK